METAYINGVLHEKVTDPVRTVLTGPQWLADMMDGLEIGSSKLDVSIDPDGNPIISKNVLDDPVWDVIAVIPSGTYSGELVRDHLTEIPFKYWKPLE